ncbi:hypothetical protein NQ317_011948 [Molorchus minor]|uniref:EF-hand domain-containing protein n=1 Tax=Molorchus minor TaxID=1323400 RepID=A0ABQ9JA91_9CUCU|nr:hypothetical protein NQ317_011948 [Molorchus minor]
MSEYRPTGIDERRIISIGPGDKNLTREQKKNVVNKLLTEIRARKYNYVINDVAFANDHSRPLARVHPAVEKWFRTMDTKNEGKISSKELQQAFETFQGKHFSDAACKFVVRLFDLDKNGGLDVNEFETLYHYIKQWLIAFNTYDRDESGFLDESELDCALKHMNISFSPDFIRFLITKNNPKAKKLSLDQYIITCIQIQRFSDEFKMRDKNFTGNITIKYEDFLEMIMRCL